MLAAGSIYFKRFFCSSFTKNGLQLLKERALVEVKGPDVTEFLQGLITNDIHHLSDGVGSMYTMFLNIKGRILYDTLIYKTEEKDLYWIECDSEATARLQKHLKIYKVKRRVDISYLDSHKVYVLYNVDSLNNEKLNNILPENSSDIKTYKDILIFKDPRVTQLGYRLISKKDSNIEELLNNIIMFNVGDSYRKFRYSLGIGEGINDLPLENCFPLECNCDYLHGVSFHKGCYIGQELTARTFHTGLVRKRLMPLFFTQIPTTLPENNVILHNNVNLGKIRGIDGNVCLALLRVNQALEYKNIKVGNGEATVIKPDWWPIELPKEKLNLHN